MVRALLDYGTHDPRVQAPCSDMYVESRSNRALQDSGLTELVPLVYSLKGYPHYCKVCTSTSIEDDIGGQLLGVIAMLVGDDKKKEE